MLYGYNTPHVVAIQHPARRYVVWLQHRGRGPNVVAIQHRPETPPPPLPTPPKDPHPKNPPPGGFFYAWRKVHEQSVQGRSAELPG